jgi:hypothetical protein
MKRHTALMLTGMTLFGCASAFAQTAAPVASIPDLSGKWGRLVMGRPRASGREAGFLSRAKKR